MTPSSVTLHTRNTVRLIATGILALLLISIVSAAPIRFDVPAQSAAEALQLFIKQAQTQVAYSVDDLKDATSHAVAGEFEPAAALALLLEGTGFEAKPQGKGYIVTRTKMEAGTVRGTVVKPEIGSSAEIRVMVRETGQQAVTDRRGDFVLANVEAGTYTLIATAEGLQTMHITDVTVRAGRELTLSRETMRKATDVTELEPFVVRGRADEVTELDKYVVEGTKQKPFTTGNLDIPRTINDAQPYYIFDAKTIDQSGAANIEDFLRLRLTMNSVPDTNGSISNRPVNGNLSTINLRGLGADKTLILVDGRRMPGIDIAGVGNQADVNGIALAQIERIEVLPASASGIYGGSAIGGVVNIILKRDYTGGTLSLRYDNTVDSDSPSRTASLNYGMALEGGKTHLSLSATWQQQSPLQLQDRLSVFQGYLDDILARSPFFLYSSGTPWLGTLPNIAAATPLILKAGNVPLNSPITFVPAGTTASTPQATLNAGLLANAGKWDYGYPDGTQYYTGRNRVFGSPAKTQSYSLSANRQMWPWLQLSMQLAYSLTNTNSFYNIFSSTGVAANSPANPFTVPITITVPDTHLSPLTTKNESRRAGVGALVKLPWNWTGLIDYSWTQTRYRYDYLVQDTVVRNADFNNGTLNPFVDVLLNPLNLAKYDITRPYSGFGGENRMLNARASGMLPALPWGQPNLTAGYERTIYTTPRQTVLSISPLTPANDNVQIFYARKNSSDSGYAETAVPLVKTDWLPGVHALDLQLSGRVQYYAAAGGTSNESYQLLTPTVIRYGTITRAGQPFFVTNRYSSNNYTVGFKYQPIKDVTVRVSRSTAFLPPTPDQLTANVDPVTLTRAVRDPKNGNVTVTPAPLYSTGGNPELLPQNSKSTYAGIIWQPQTGPLVGLRLNVEYSWVQQFNAIAAPGAAQFIVDREDEWPDRVIRDATGKITLVDGKLGNLYLRESDSWDLNGDYQRKTGWGTFSLHAAATINASLKVQNSKTLPKQEFVDAPHEGGLVKYQANAQLGWEKGRWMINWSANYTPSYKQYGAPGGPLAIQGSPVTTYTLAQGGDRVSSQLYHTVMAGWSYDRQKSATASRRAAKLLSGLSVQVGVRNVFDKLPPLDTYNTYNLFLASYSDVRLQTYWLNVTKTF